MEPNLNRKVKLPAIAWKMIRDLLNAPGWATTPKDIFVAGKMDDEGTIGLPHEPEKLTSETDEAWCSTPVEIEISENQREAIKKCLLAHVSRGAIGANKWSWMALREFAPE